MTPRLSNRIWAVANIVAVAAALGLTASTIAGASADLRGIARRYLDAIRLQKLVEVQQADRIAADALRAAGSRPPDLLPWLQERIPGTRIDTRERDRTPLIDGWSLVRVDVMIEDAVAETVFAALGAAATNPQPWRAAECQVTATGPGRARFTVLVEGVEAGDAATP